MKHRSLSRISIIALLTAPLIACATNPGIMKSGPDTYTLYKEDHAGIFGNPASLRAEVINEANSFAEGQGKIAMPVSAKSHHMSGRPADWETFEYEFRLIDKNDHSTHRTRLLPDSDVVVDEEGKVIGSSTTATNQSKPQADIYSELTKLDELRKKGILTQAEFEAQKRRILGNN